MTQVAELTAKLSADIRDFTKGMRRAESDLRDLDDATVKATRSTGNATAGLKKLAVAAGGAYALKKFGDQLWQAGQAASDFNESINAVEVATGDAAEGILKMGTTAATELGLSKTAVNEAAVAFSAFNDKIGGGADTFKEYATRATDFASVMNLDVNQALQIFQSGLAGESEPLRRFGLDLSAASVNAYAYANGIADAGAELTEAEKVQARYGTLLQQTDKFAGDFANTSGELAGQQKVLAAELENARIELGENLLPLMLKATQAGIALIGVVTNTGKAYQVWETRAREFNHTISLGLIGDADPMSKSWKAFNQTQNHAIQLMEDGAGAANVFRGWLKRMSDEGVFSAETLDAMNATLGFTDEEFKSAIVSATGMAEALGLNETQVAALAEYFHGLNTELGTTDGELYTLEEAARAAAGGFADFATATERVAAATADLISTIGSGSWIRNASDRIQISRFLGPGGASRDEGRGSNYASGGLVPGPLGAPRLATVHGGEEILTASQRFERNVTVNMNGNVTSGGNLTDELTTGLLMAGVNEHAEFRGISDIR